MDAAENEDGAHNECDHAPDRRHLEDGAVAVLTKLAAVAVCAAFWHMRIVHTGTSQSLFVRTFQT